MKYQKVSISTTINMLLKESSTTKLPQ